MKKLFFLSSILFFSIRLFSQDVSAVLQAPANATQGQEFEISITVNKADVTGFARLQLDVPSGFSVKASQTQGSTFSFKDNKIRFLWMTLPADKSLKVICLVTADNTVSGNVSIEGSFSYVLNNETKRFTMPAQIVAFGGNAIASSNEDAKRNAEKLEKERQESLAKEKAEHDKLALEQAEKEAKEEADRLAQQYALSQNTNATPEVKTADQDIKPSTEVVSPETKTTNQDIKPSTEVVSPETKTTNQDLKPSTEIASPETKTTNQDLKPSTEVVNVPAKTTAVKSENSEPVKTNNYSSNTNTNTSTSHNSSPSASSSKGAVEYKIQIGAFKSTPASGFYKKLEKNISEFQIKTSKDPDGFVRYFIGSFDNFSSVDNLQRRIKELGYASFIVANKNGEKITIKQAKEISKN